MPKKGLLNWTEGLVRAATRKGNWDDHRKWPWPWPWPSRRNDDGDGNGSELLRVVAHMAGQAGGNREKVKAEIRAQLVSTVKERFGGYV